VGDGAADGTVYCRVAGGVGSCQAGAWSSWGTLVQRDQAESQSGRGRDQHEEREVYLLTVVPGRPGVRLVNGVLYYSSAWLDSTRPVLASVDADSEAGAVFRSTRE
jgi:hypothetical protein